MYSVHKPIGIKPNAGDVKQTNETSKTRDIQRVCMEGETKGEKRWTGKKTNRKRAKENPDGYGYEPTRSPKKGAFERHLTTLSVAFR